MNNFFHIFLNFTFCKRNNVKIILLIIFYVFSRHIFYLIIYVYNEYNLKEDINKINKFFKLMEFHYN